MAGLSSCGVLDHLLVDVIGTIRASFDRALLQRQAVEERFQVDVFLGDVSWETSYSLPGEEQPPRVRADVSVDWPTWSQTSYRSWSIGEPPDELPEVVIEVALRVQRMAEAPDTEKVMAALPATGPLGDPSDLVRTATTIEQVRTEADEADGAMRWAAEATYEGSLRFSEQQLDDPSHARAGLRRPDPLDRLDAYLAGRPALHLPAPRGGRRLTRSLARRAPHRPRPRPCLRRRARRLWLSAPGAPPANQGLTLNQPTPQHVALTNQHGQTVSLASLRGKVVVLAPFLSLCQDECPLVTGAFISLQRDLRAAGLARPRRLRGGHGRPGPRHRGPPGRVPEGVRRRLGPLDGHAGRHRGVLEAVRRRVPDRARGATAQDRLVDRQAAHLRRRPHGRLHPDQPAGRERFVDATAPNEKGQLDPKLRGLLNEGGLHELENPQAPDWTTADALAAISWLLGTNVPTPSP